MSGVVRLRFTDLAIQCGINALEPLPRIGKVGVFLQILSHLIANEIGVNNKKHCWQESLALCILATEDALRPQH